MNGHPQIPYAAPTAHVLAPHPGTTQHHALQAAVAVAAQQQHQHQHPAYLSHSASAGQVAPPFVLATHVSVPVTVQQPQPQPAGSSHPSIYKPQTSDLKRLSQLMLDSSASSPINLTPFDALLLDADSLMELGSLMQAKAAELATDISKYREGSERSGVAPDGPMGSSLASTNASVQRLQAELDAVIGELNRALTDLHSSKQWESKFEQLRTQHLNTSNELTQALASNKALQARVEALERKSSVAVTSQQAQLQMRVQHLAAASEKSEKQAKQWQSAARSLRSQLEGLKADHDEKLVALQRKHERALLCQMRASVRALKAIQSRQRYSRRSGAESDSNRAQPTTTPTLEEPDLKLPPRSPATPDATKADLQVTVKHDIGSSAGRTAMLDSNNSLPVDP